MRKIIEGDSAIAAEEQPSQGCLHSREYTPTYTKKLYIKLHFYA